MQGGACRPATHQTAPLQAEQRRQKSPPPHAEHEKGQEQGQGQGPELGEAHPALDEPDEDESCVRTAPAATADAKTEKAPTTLAGRDGYRARWSDDLDVDELICSFVDIYDSSSMRLASSTSPKSLPKAAGWGHGN